MRNKEISIVQASTMLLVSMLVLSCILPTQAGLFYSLFSPIRAAYDNGLRILGIEERPTFGYPMQEDSRARSRYIIHSRDVEPPAPRVWIEPAELSRSAVEDTSPDQYQAKCFRSRSFSFRDDPRLYFFSSKFHSNETQGCNVELEVPLNTTRADSNYEPKLDIDPNRLKTDLIDSGRYVGNFPTYVMIHGFRANWSGNNWMCQMKDLILDNARANVIIVDWSGGAKPKVAIDYSAAVGNTNYIAQLLSEFIKILASMSGQEDARNFHLIGHSLGAHISGFVGYSLTNLGRITGLDPAGPCFSSDTPDQREEASHSGRLKNGKRRLSPDSANFVLAIHTDTAFFGLNENCGHHDIYVNGGYKQPKCGAVTLTDRVNAFYNLDLNSSLSTDIACSHSFAYKLMDSFVSSSTRDKNQVAVITDQSGDNRLSATHSVESRCFPMAYHCSNWDAFRAGECGYCLQGNPNCLYIGLSLIQDQPRMISDQEPPDSEYKPRSNMEGEDDGKFNDEESSDNEGDHKDEFIPSEKYSRGQHFLRTSAARPTCMYHYQIIIASRRSHLANVKDGHRYYYYLQVPIGSQGSLVDAQGQRLPDRLIQVSHKVNPRSEAHIFLRNTHLELMARQDPQIESYIDDIEFYTALITFHQAPADECSMNNEETGGAMMSQKWQLCRPLNNMKEARLWSSNESKLNAVQMVAMNYMSGLNFNDRVSNSWVFDRDLDESLSDRYELDEMERAQIGHLAPDQPKTMKNVVKKSVRCLLSYLDKSDTRKASRSFKCNRSANELRYSIKLYALQQRPL